MEIRKIVESSDRVVGQNLKFDAAMLREAGVIKEWPWGKTEDTIIAGHLLKSSQAHDLTTMALVYLGVNIEPLETELRKWTIKARNRVQQAQLKSKRAREKGLKIPVDPLAKWRIAKEGMPEMPSAKEKTWAIDMWLLQHFEGGKYADKLRDYANADSAVTLQLWKVLEAKVKKEGLWEIYREKMRVAKVVYDMESRPVAVLRDNHRSISWEYAKESDEYGQVCLGIAEERGYELNLPKGSNNQSLTTFAFDVLNLPVVKHTKTGKPAMDKDVFEMWPLMLDPGSDQLRFVRSLKAKRKRGTALGFLAAYEKFWLETEDPRYCDLYSSLNQTGTHTLRFSMSNPNLQQVSKQESKCDGCDGEGCEACGGSGADLHSIRKVFGPRPGREWWCLDYENIELRIPAYESGERAMIELFERPEDPPYFGSYHLLNASIVYPDLFRPLANKKGAFKEKYNADWYQYCKNGGFAIQYGCQEAKADATFRRKGAYRAIKEKMPAVARLNDRYVDFANRHGYVETLPDKTLDCKRGHPIWCSVGGWGKVSPTVPLNYHVQSTAMWCTSKAMVRCSDYLAEVSRETGKEYRIALQVHDEIVFDFPRGGRANLPKVRTLQRLMSRSGDDVGIPLTVAASYHPKDWATKEKLCTSTK